MDVRDFENYMKGTANAVLAVVESAEKLKGSTIDVEDAALIFAMMYGETPKPSAHNVAAVVAASSSLSARQKIMEGMDDKTMLTVSAARFGMEHNRLRAEANAKLICKIMEDITPPSYQQQRSSAPSKVHVGLNDDNSPRVDCNQYTLEGAVQTITAASFSKPTVLTGVEAHLKDIFSRIDPQPPDSFQYVKSLATSNSIASIVTWADAVETALRTTDPAERAASHLCTDSPLVSRCASDVKRAMMVIMEVVGKSYCRTVTQLSSAQDIDKFDKATETCYKALMSDTHERILCSMLFYMCFQILAPDTQDYVKNVLGALSGAAKTTPVAVRRRSAAETLFGLCFMFKVLPSEFVGSVLTFPPGALSYHGLSGTCLGPLLANYGPRFEEPWARFKELLAERRATVRSVRGRLDTVDAGANLTGPVYVLVSDAAQAFQAQRTSTETFLNELKEKYELWDTFTRWSARGT